MMLIKFQMWFLRFQLIGFCFCFSFSGFQKRHPNLTIRTPEACSIARAEAFNKVNVAMFYDKLREVMSRHPSFADGSRVANLDETSTSTVQNVRKIICPKGVKQVHKIKSAERGVSVTTCCIVGAYGTVIPPVLIFPRKKFVPHMMNNAFPGSLGLANEKGYMTKETFTEVLRHVIKCYNVTPDNPLLLIMDNVDTHFSIATLSLARKHGVTFLTFPPHCTHKMQPLDISFFGPFKSFYDSAINDWILSHPAQSVTIYQVAEFVKIAMSRAGSVGTISAGFAKAGIFPFDSNIFSDADFVMSKVTELPHPSTGEDAGPDLDDPGHNQASPDSTPANSREMSEKSSPSNSRDTSVASPAGTPYSDGGPMAPREPSSSGQKRKFISPMEFRGLPKRKQTETIRNPRKKAKSCIPTDTPEKDEIERKELEIKEKKRKTEENKKQRLLKTLQEELGEQPNKPKPKKRKQTKRVLSFESDCESDDSAAIDDPPQPAEPPKLLPDLERDPEEEDFVLICLWKGRVQKYFVAQIIKGKDSDGDYEVKYYHRKPKEEKFHLPDVPELCSVKLQEIKAILPKPTWQEKKTKRQQSYHSFNFKFDGLNLG